MKVPSRSLASLMALCAIGLVSCAREAAPELPSAQPYPSPPEEPKAQAPLSDLDALEHDLAVSEARLDEQLARRDDYAKEDAEARKPDTPAAPPPPSATGTTASPPKTPATAGASPPSRELTGEERVASGSPCDMACRALASMQRSVDGICRLAGEAHERCRGARDKVQRAADRVAQAGCQCEESRE